MLIASAKSIDFGFVHCLILFIIISIIIDRLVDFETTTLDSISDSSFWRTNNKLLKSGVPILSEDDLLTALFADSDLLVRLWYTVARDTFRDILNSESLVDELASDCRDTFMVDKANGVLWHFHGSNRFSSSGPFGGVLVRPSSRSPILDNSSLVGIASLAVEIIEVSNRSLVGEFRPDELSQRVAESLEGILSNIVSSGLKHLPLLRLVALNSHGAVLINGVPEAIRAK